MPFNISPSVTPVAQNMTSPFTKSEILYFLLKSVIPNFFALFTSVSSLKTSLVCICPPKQSSAAAANTPSGPPPIPKNRSTLYFLSDTNNAPDTSPSCINLICTCNFLIY